MSARLKTSDRVAEVRHLAGGQRRYGLLGDPGVVEQLQLHLDAALLLPRGHKSAESLVLGRIEALIPGRGFLVTEAARLVPDLGEE
jgi:hypothetical protein